MSRADKEKSTLTDIGHFVVRRWLKMVTLLLPPPIHPLRVPLSLFFFCLPAVRHWLSISGDANELRHNFANQRRGIGGRRAQL